MENAKTNNIGDGIILVSNVEAAYKIRTGKKGCPSQKFKSVDMIDNDNRAC